MVIKFEDNKISCFKNNIFKFYPLMVALFVTLQIECILFVNKQIDVFYLSSTLSGITFPINLLILAVVVNCYGKQSAKQLIWINNVIVIQFVIYNLLANYLDWSSKNQNFDVMNAYNILIPIFIKSGLAALFAENVADFLFVFVYSNYRNNRPVYKNSYLKEFFKMVEYSFMSNFVMLAISYSIIFWKKDLEYTFYLICQVMILKSIIEIIFSPIAIYTITKIKNCEGFGIRDFAGNNPFTFLIKYEYLNFYQIISNPEKK
jgi:uncharacterized PurR-regulated membrane protein YhhQ (DUF165 family)